MIKIDPATWLFNRASNKREANIRIADYLDAISAEATDLATIWQGIVKNLSQHGSASAKNDIHWMGFIDIPEQHQF